MLVTEEMGVPLSIMIMVELPNQPRLRMLLLEKQKEVGKKTISSQNVLDIKPSQPFSAPSLLLMIHVIKDDSNRASTTIIQIDLYRSAN